MTNDAILVAMKAWRERMGRNANLDALEAALSAAAPLLIAEAFEQAAESVETPHGTMAAWLRQRSRIFRESATYTEVGEPR